MPITAGDNYVRSGASGSFTSIEYVQGGWTTVPSGSDLTGSSGIYIDRLKDGQVVYAEKEDQLYIVSKFVAFETPGYGGFVDSASFATTNLGISGGGGSTDTGSLLISASNSGSTEVITFTKGDNSTFDLTVISASYAVSASHEIVTEVSSSHAVNADTSSLSDTIKVAGNNDNVNAYVPFTQTADGGGALLTDPGILYNAQNNLLSTTASYASFAITASHALNAGGGSGDITAVTAGDGLAGGASSGDATLSLDTSSAHFISGSFNIAVFQHTGSSYNTTNDIQITGSLTVGDGLLKLKEFTTTPAAEAGGIFYSASNFYFGVD